MRLRLHAAASWVLWLRRFFAPKRSLWRKAQADTIRLRFLKVAATNMDYATRIVVQSSSA